MTAPTIDAMDRPAAASRGPIFVGGPDRCGKTMLAAILGSHPNIAIPIVGSNMWTYFYGQFGDLTDDRALERCLEAMLRYTHVAFVRPDAERIRREFRSGERSYPRLFALFQQHFAEREGKPRWGDQTGLIERYADQVFEAYPDARMVHMLRDPRDRYAASLRLWPNGRLRAGGAAARWLYSARLAERNARRYRDRYRIVRYEDLVADPEGTIRDVCRFVGETFVDSMLEMGDAPTYRAKLADATATTAATSRAALSTEFIGMYRGVMADHETEFMQRMLGRRMAALGYSSDFIPMPVTRRLHAMVVDWPLDGARMVGWLGLEALQHRFPGRLGRMPTSTKVAPA